ncbi:hypothetical protein [Massilia sp. TS11]|uniref:hypothetical protein n=1 Tax=Massilia sp. TS11 TaxID=2908003 RepID=UPI001EDB7987|nr:hypothetical protein [Massilia sp. TS11]MCG2584438.1 hypothetical protein [Massilia sp. TS11]
MAKIIAGHFELAQEIEAARRALMEEADIPSEHICGFYLNQPGQHNLSPIGGDHIVSPGAKQTPTGVAEGMTAGGMAGAVIGAATAAVSGPLGPLLGALLGAHVGSLYSFSRLKDKGEPEPEPGNEAEPRKAGMMVAVAIRDDEDEAPLVALLQQLGASQIERAQGRIEHGDWKDFNPNIPPDYVV